MQQSTDIQIIADFSPNASIVLGKDKKLNFNLSNISSTQKAYNLSAELVISEGMDLESSIPEYTSFTKDDLKRYITTNFKDFAPQEGDFKLEYNIKSLEQFDDGSEVPFGTNLTAILNIVWDSMPRGNEDIGNEQYFNIYNISLTTSQVEVVKALPSKHVKGAGDENLAASKIFDCYVEINNNARQSSSFTISDILPNGFRYLGGITVVEATQNPLPIPTLSANLEDGTQNLFFSNYTILAGEVLKFYYKAAIYDKYMLDGIANSGQTITHGSLLEGSISLADEVVLDFMEYNIRAMDVVITAIQDKSIVDCSMQVNYTLKITSNQYHDLNAVNVKALVPDGQIPVSFPGGTQGAQTVMFSIPVDYVVGELEKDSTESLNLTTEVAYSYRSDESLVACGDEFLLTSTVEATNSDSSQAVNDNASTTQSIITGSIQKAIVNRLYRNLTNKTTTALARLDYIDYELTYDSTGIKAAQKGIQLDDYFPLQCYLPIQGAITQLLGIQITPLTIDPHGLRWVLGDVGADTVWKVKVRVQVSETAENGNMNNLFKLDGISSDGSAYSKRDNVSNYIGRPNIVVSRTLEGIDVKKVESGQRYKASVTFTNTQTEENTATDAFDFNIFAELLNGIIIDEQSVVISGTGTWNSAIFEGERIVVYIKRLKIGESVTIYYEALIPDNIPPAYSATLASQSEIPYTQPFNILFSNVKYSMEAVRTNFILRSAKMVFTNDYLRGIKQIGSEIKYAITATIPKGTAVFNCTVENTLPAQQSYAGEATFNGEIVTPEIVGRVVTFPTSAYFYSADNDVVLTYAFTANIEDADSSTAEVIQTNEVKLMYEDNNQIQKSAQVAVDVEVSNPLLSLILGAEKDVLSSSQSTKLILLIKNIGKVSAGNVVITADIPINTAFVSASSTLGVPTYNEALRKVDLSIGTLGADSQVTLNYSVKGDLPLSVGDIAVMSAISNAYTNTVDQTKEYPLVSSNNFELEVASGVVVTIFPPYRSQNGNGYVLVAANSIAYVPYTVVNKGGGIDSFMLNITTSKYPYKIEYNGQVVEDIPSYTQYSGTPAGFDNVASGAMVKFRLIFAVPSVQLYDRNPYTITVKSLSDTSTEATIFTDMVDP